MQDIALPKRRFPWALVVIAVIALGGAAWFFVPRAPEKAKTTTATVDKGDVVVRVTATGTLSAIVTVQVGSQVSGRINEIMADYNSPVKKGQVIARLDRQLLDAAVTESRANFAAASAAVDRAKVQAANADRQRDRARELGTKNLIAQSDLDAAELAAKVAEADVGSSNAQLEQAKSSLDRAQINLGYATIYAPIDGVVISRAVDVGQTVAASLQAPTLFTIAQDLKLMQVDTSVGEADIGKITAGMEASFTVDAWPGEKFVGHVRQIRNAPQTVQNVVTYDVVIDVDNAALRLKPGMTANAAFVVATKNDVLRVPNAALRFKAPKSFRGGKDDDAHGPGMGGGAGKHGHHDGGDAKDAHAAKEAHANGDAATSADAKRAHGAGEVASADAKGAHGSDGAQGGGDAKDAHAAGDVAHGGGDVVASNPAEGGNVAGAGQVVKAAEHEVWVMRGDKPAAVTIHTGLSDGSVTEVLDGDVKEGDEIVTEAVDPAEGKGGGQGQGGMPRRMF